MTDSQEAPGVPETEVPAASADPVAEVEQAAAALEPEADDPDPRVANANREAAGYRRRLRETEAERDDLRARFEAYEREKVERAAAGLGFHEPSDIWMATPDLAPLRGDSGHIDDALVVAHLRAVGRDRPHWVKPWPNCPPGPQGVVGQLPPATPGEALAQSLQAAKRRRR